jgi:hypothetical protein
MRRNRIQVSSGTYCKALAQLERRMMSQIDLTKAESDWVEAMALGCAASSSAIEGIFRPFRNMDADTVKRPSRKRAKSSQSPG